MLELCLYFIIPRGFFFLFGKIQCWSRDQQLFWKFLMVSRFFFPIYLSKSRCSLFRCYLFVAIFYLAIHLEWLLDFISCSLHCVDLSEWRCSFSRSRRNIKHKSCFLSLPYLSGYYFHLILGLCKFLLMVSDYNLKGVFIIYPVFQLF